MRRRPVSLRAFALSGALLVMACARPRPMAYTEAAARASRAAHAGRHDEAAARWTEAAPLADRARDVDDAHDRAAHALLRAGHRDRALEAFDVLARDATHPPIAARAALEAALLRLERDQGDDRARAVASLDALVVQHPQRGLGRRALDHRLRLFDEAGDGEGAVDWLRARHTDARLRDTDLDPAVTHLLALRRAAAGAREEATRLWQDLFARRGFGHNPHWDDGHLALAQTRLDAGDPRGAIDALDALFAPWTTSWLVGSYTGPRMPEAAMLRARIYRDHLGDVAGATEAYRFVFDRLSHSTRRDDALAECAAMLEATAPTEACALWQRLFTELPCSPRARRATGMAVRCGGEGSRAGCEARPGSGR
ncbi:MAG: hypothetical protein U0325_00380 [Polyangiales bacterium]